jgi:hypothetical protein
LERSRGKVSQCPFASDQEVWKGEREEQREEEAKLGHAIGRHYRLVQWLTPVIPATWKVGDREDCGLRPAGQTARPHLSQSKLAVVTQACHPSCVKGINKKTDRPR